MNKTDNKFIPELRFPEFVKDGEWKKEYLSNFLDFQTGYPFDSEGFNENDIGVRLIKNRDLKSDDKKVFYNKPFDKKYIVKDGDVLIGMDGDFTPCVWKRGEALLNQRVGRILTHESNQEIFFYYFLSIHLKSIEEKTAKTTVKHLSHSDVEKIYEPLPSSSEQQKIADCLSSLDDLITAHTDKLDALKAHKKGLMQNLFPQEGETVPKFRFKGFEKDGAWVKTSLNEHIDLLSGFAFQSSFFSTTGQKLITPKNFTKNGLANFDENNTKYTIEPFNKKYLCKSGDLLLLLTDLTPSCELLGKPVILKKVDGEVLLNQRIVKVKDTGKITKDFLLQFFLTDSYHKRIRNTASGSTVRHSSNKIIFETELFYPSNPNEQQKIANTLSALDELIKQQTDKIEQLKQHKKGLMQGLFPSSSSLSSL